MNFVFSSFCFRIYCILFFSFHFFTIFEFSLHRNYNNCIYLSKSVDIKNNNLFPFKCHKNKPNSPWFIIYNHLYIKGRTRHSKKSSWIHFKMEREISCAIDYGGWKKSWASDNLYRFFMPHAQNLRNWYVITRDNKPSFKTRPCQFIFKEIYHIAFMLGYY